LLCMGLTADFTRCNNVLWISAAKGVEMNGEGPDTKMEG